MPTIIYMPEVLANVTEAAIAKWTISEGDTVTAGNVLAEVETEKALVDYVAEHTGVLARYLVEEGATVAVGQPIAILRLPEDSDADVSAASGTVQEDASDAAPSGDEVPAASTSPSIQDAGEDAPVPQAEPSTVSSGAAPSHKTFASPLARKLAKEQGINIEDVTGSGPNGRIVRRDVETAIASLPTSSPAASSPIAPAPPTPPAPSSGVSSALPGHTTSAHSGMRKAIARRLTESKTSVPHYYVSIDCNVDALLSLRHSVNEGRDVRISVNDFVVKAVTKALMTVSQANVMWTDDAMLHFEEVNVAVAVSTDSGLLTPVIRAASSLSIESIATQTREYAQDARAGKLRQDSLEGGTFTVTNLGMFGVPEFSAILNPPQSGILAVGAAVKQPVVIDDRIEVATIMRVTLSADHRAVDGAVAAQLLSEFRRLIEHPLNILI